MLKVWRGKNNTLFAECTACGSFGTANHLQLKQKLEPEIEAALERHTAHMIVLRSHFMRAAGVIAKQVHDGSMSRDDGTKQIRGLYENHVAQVMLGQAALPDPSGEVAELATNCPWCNIAEEAEVETLPEGKDHPDFELAKPIAAYMAKNLKKEG